MFYFTTITVYNTLQVFYNLADAECSISGCIRDNSWWMVSSSSDKFRWICTHSILNIPITRSLHVSSLKTEETSGTFNSCYWFFFRLNHEFLERSSTWLSDPSCINVNVKSAYLLRKRLSTTLWQWRIKSRRFPPIYWELHFN